MTEDGRRAECDIGRNETGGEGGLVNGIDTVENLDRQAALISSINDATRIEAAISVLAIEATIAIVVDTIVADLWATRWESEAIGIKTVDGSISVVVDTIAASHTVTLETIRRPIAVRIEAIDETIEIVVDTVVADLRTDYYKVDRELSYSGSTR